MKAACRPAANPAGAEAEDNGEDENDGGWGEGEGEEEEAAEEDVPVGWWNYPFTNHGSLKHKPWQLEAQTMAAWSPRGMKNHPPWVRSAAREKKLTDATSNHLSPQHCFNSRLVI